ncbi:MAG: PhzF family phenazine biosynthesis protein, partial [Eubacteriales bacterium]|nr:PhzF family phenazine biosynthesis protein [Eubacteriales bacterium]
MKTLKFKKIDAFTKGSSAGNPAGYLLMDRDSLLSVQEMQQIAAELKGFVNEVGFVYQTGNDYRLRFYSSECEVAFCGHATIAIMYDLLKGNRELQQKKEVQIHVNAGALSVLNQIAEEDAVYIMAPAPEFFDCTVNAEQISKALGIPSSHIDGRLPVRLIDGGLRTLIVPVITLKSCLGICPDQEKLRLFCLENGIDIIHVSTKETFFQSCRYRTRVFAPKFGYLEDPATGSGNAAFGSCLINENGWDGDFTIEQGQNGSNPNFIKLRKKELDGIDRILFGGCATTR